VPRVQTCVRPVVAREFTVTSRPPPPVRHTISTSTGRLTRIAALLCSVACRPGDRPAVHTGDGGTTTPGGTVVISMGADAEPLIPPYAAQVQTKLIVDQLFDRLADLGDSLNTVGDRGFLPRLAQRWDWSADSLSIAFHLDPRARWHDGVPVRANDVRFTYRIYSDTAAGIDATTQIAQIDSVTAPDSLTARFWFKRRYPEQFFDATYQMLILPEHLLGAIKLADLRTSAFGRHPVGDGRFRFSSWSPGTSLTMIADTGNYRGRATLDRVVISLSPTPGAAIAKLFTGDADFIEILHPEEMAEIGRHPELVMLPYADPTYGFLWFNLRAGGKAPHPLFGSRPLRRALAMALDRVSMARNVFDTLAVVPRGPFPSSSPVADTTASSLPYDTAAAMRVLDSLGWRRGADGVRRRNGQPLAFAIAVPPSSKPRTRMAVLVQDQLARIGVRVTIDPVELRTLVTRLQKGDFDAAIWAWHTDASMSDLRQTWTKPAERLGTNWGAYENPVFDAAVDSALTTTDPARMRAYFHRAYTTITDDAPAVWLYQPRQVAGIQRRIQTAYMRPDAWWAHLADWSVPVTERIPRDRIGLADAAP
jgi:peptide/nickel transport system substrate-binding protein